MYDSMLFGEEVVDCINCRIEPSFARHLRVIEEKMKFGDTQLICIYDLLSSIRSLPEGTYYLERGAFKTFCEWAQFCDEKHVETCVSIFRTIFRCNRIYMLVDTNLLGRTFRSFLRTDVGNVFYKNCDVVFYLVTKNVPGIIDESLIRYLHDKLRSKDIRIFKVALKTIYFLFVQDLHCVAKLILDCGFNLVNLFKSRPELTQRCMPSVVGVMYAQIFAFARMEMTIFLYDLLKEALEFPVECLDYCAIRILTHFADTSSFEEYFLKSNLATVLVRTLKSCEYVDKVLLLLQKVVLQKRLGHILLFETDCYQWLKGMHVDNCSKYVIEVLKAFWRVHLPLKFNECNRIGFGDKLDEGFYLTDSQRPFCLIEHSATFLSSPMDVTFVVDGDDKIPRSMVVSKEHRRRTFISKLRKFFKRRDQDEKSIMKRSYGLKSSDLNYGSISSDPFLNKYLAQIKPLTKYLDDIDAKVKVLGKFVAEVIRLPDSKEDYKAHVKSLKAMLGSTIIPIGFIRLGYTRERALLFKALADKVNLKTNLVRRRIPNINEFVYWNELLDDRHRPFSIIVDLMQDAGSRVYPWEIDINTYGNPPT